MSPGVRNLSLNPRSKIEGISGKGLGEGIGVITYLGGFRGSQRESQKETHRKKTGCPTIPLKKT